MATTVRLKTDTIKARPHSRISNADAKKIAPVLFAIERQYGVVTVDEVLARAQKLSSPLHKHFEWDNDAAAAKHRIDQARDLIRSVVYEVEVIGSSVSKPTRSFQPVMVNVQSSADDDTNPMPAGYVSVTRALADEPMRAKILVQAAKELDAWTRRYHTLELLAASIKIVARTARKIRGRALALKRKRR